MDILQTVEHLEATVDDLKINTTNKEPVELYTGSLFVAYPHSSF